MSAELLREAARLMRERAKDAISSHGPGSWRTTPSLDPENEGWIVAFGSREDDFDTTVARLPYDFEGDLAPHIASWHPAVALAVADWLDTTADTAERFSTETFIVRFGWGYALAVARAYLGTDTAPVGVTTPMPSAGAARGES